MGIEAWKDLDDPFQQWNIKLEAVLAAFSEA